MYEVYRHLTTPTAVVVTADPVAVGILALLIAVGVIVLVSSLILWRIVRSEQTWAAVGGAITATGGSIALAYAGATKPAWFLGIAGVAAMIFYAIHAEYRVRADDRHAFRLSETVTSAADAAATETSVNHVSIGSPSVTSLANGESGEDDNESQAVFEKTSTLFFYNRFIKAFPGVRGVSVLRPPDAYERLSILLRQPLEFEGEWGTYNPIWFWGRGDFYIQRFSLLSDDLALMDVQELILDEVAAVNVGGYYQAFVYVKTRPAKQSGLYEYTDEDLAHPREYINEEVGLVDGRYISRAEYDDGAAVIDGKVVDVSGRVELRVRYLTAYNFIIAGQRSPVNSRRGDEALSPILNGILRGEQTIDDLAKFVQSLPKKDSGGRQYW